MDTTLVTTARILSQRLAVLSYEDGESRKRTQQALASVRARIAELEAMEFGDDRERS